MGDFDSLYSSLHSDSRIRGEQFEQVCKWFLENDPGLRPRAHNRLSVEGLARPVERAGLCTFAGRVRFLEPSYDEAAVKSFGIASGIPHGRRGRSRWEQR